MKSSSELALVIQLGNWLRNWDLSLNRYLTYRLDVSLVSVETNF